MEPHDFIYKLLGWVYDHPISAILILMLLLGSFNVRVNK